MDDKSMQEKKSNERIMKKAQMEILGLVIIIVLLSLGLLFYLKFSLLNEGDDVQKFFSQTRVAVNTPNTLLATSVPVCSKKTIQELLRDCVTSQITVCSNGENSCEASERVIRYILEESLAKRNIKYEFEAFIEANPPILKMQIINEAGCPEDRESETFPIRLYPDPRTLMVRLNVC